MGLFSDNITGGPPVTAQVIREFQSMLEIGPDDDVKVVVDKICNYIFYWVHAQLLDYKSFTIHCGTIVGFDNIKHWDSNLSKYKYNPKIDEVVNILLGRGFETEINSSDNTIKIKW